MSSAGCPSLSYSAFRPTLHMRAATRLLSQLPVYTVISTHAPRAGSDFCMIYYITSPSNFNPRSPCGERRGGQTCRRLILGFQSTLPVRGATSHVSRVFAHGYISIHAPRAGSDVNKKYIGGERKQFQSTLPVRGATDGQNRRKDHQPISIHAPRAGSDSPRFPKTYQVAYFNPRSPCGERRAVFRVLPLCSAYFNPRSPCGERLRDLVEP